jgi:hypothetical protein
MYLGISAVYRGCKSTTPYNSTDHCIIHLEKCTCWCQSRVGQSAQSRPGYQLESPGAALQTLSAIERTRQTRQSGGRGDRPGTECLYVGYGATGPCDPIALAYLSTLHRASNCCDPPLAEAQPRCGATLGGVMRRQETREPRARPAPDGPKEGGTQSTDSSVINRRVLLAPALPRDAGSEDKENAKTSVAYP